jgi:hypothetical protein
LIAEPTTAAATGEEVGKGHDEGQVQDKRWLLQTQLKGLQSSINRSIAFADQLLLHKLLL